MEHAYLVLLGVVAVMYLRQAVEPAPRGHQGMGLHALAEGGGAVVPAMLAMSMRPSAGSMVATPNKGCMATRSQAAITSAMPLR